MGEGQLVRLRCALPYGEGGVEAFLSDEKYLFDNRYGSDQLAIAGSMIAADLIQTAKFGRAAMCANVGICEGVLPPRGGFRGWPSFDIGLLVRCCGGG